jgi:hypothetical protein
LRFHRRTVAVTHPAKIAVAVITAEAADCWRFFRELHDSAKRSMLTCECVGKFLADAFAMLAELYIETLLADYAIADELWALWVPGLIWDEPAAWEKATLSTPRIEPANLAGATRDKVFF